MAWLAEAQAGKSPLRHHLLSIYSTLKVFLRSPSKPSMDGRLLVRSGRSGCHQSIFFGACYHRGMEPEQTPKPRTEAATEENGLVRKLITSGADIAGAAVAGGLGFLAGSLGGAAVLGISGAAAAMVLKNLGQEISRRLLGPREAVRVGGVLALTAEEIRQRIEQGERIRTDGFFEKDSSGRSGAEEVGESVLLKCQREPEEKKLPYMAHLLSGIVFDSEISADMAHQITKAAEQMTYRQLCLIKIAVIKDLLNLRTSNYRGHGPFSKDLYQILYECHDLYNRGFVSFGGEASLGPTDMMPGRMKVQGLGGDIFNLMKLGLIPDEDLTPIIEKLK